MKYTTKPQFFLLNLLQIAINDKIKKVGSNMERESSIFDSLNAILVNDEVMRESPKNVLT
jgi:hypothetical protein